MCVCVRACVRACMSMLANGRSQFLLVRLGRCFKLFVSTESTSCHEFASHFGLEIFFTRKTPNTIANTELLECFRKRTDTFTLTYRGSDVISLCANVTTLTGHYTN